MSIWDNPAEVERWIKRQISSTNIEQIVTRGINERRIIIPRPSSGAAVFSGGTNFCPNSDFSWSQMAATTPATTPATAGDTNQEVYRLYRQTAGAALTTDRVRAVGHSLYAGSEGTHPWIPIWDRVNGTVKLGYGGVGGENWDIAFQLTNNWIAPSQRWYVRVALATEDSTPLPVGTKLYAGFWVKQSGGSEGWADGDNFVLSYSLPVTGSRNIDYKVIAKSDSGVETESAVLNVPDAPDSPSSDNNVRISYSGAAGLIEFILYRKEAGMVYEIARQRNSNQLWAFDNGQVGTFVGTSFPSAATSVYRSYAEVVVDAVSIEVSKTFNNLTIQVPSSFDASTLASEGVYLRIGIVGDTATDRQVIIDTVWCSQTYNTWSPSSFDDYPSPPSTSITTGVPTGGTNPTGDPPPNGGGNTCVWDGHSLLLADRSSVKLEHATSGIAVDNGDGYGIVKSYINSEIDQYWVVVFTNGLVVLCSSTHRFVRSLNDNSGVLADYLNEGDKVLGVRLSDTSRTVEMFKVDYKEHTSGKMVGIRFVEIEEGSKNKFYAVGSEDLGLFAYAHNRKYDDYNA